MQHPQKKFFSIMMRGQNNWSLVKKGFFLQTLEACSDVSGARRAMAEPYLEKAQ